MGEYTEVSNQNLNFTLKSRMTGILTGLINFEPVNFVNDAI